MNQYKYINNKDKLEWFIDAESLLEAGFDPVKCTYIGVQITFNIQK